MRKWLQCAVNLAEIALVYLIGFACYLLNPRYRDVWMVIERGTDARDNGYVFFRYLREHHPGIRAVYVIAKDSPDYPKVRKLGRVCEFMSLEHKILTAVSAVKASTHHNINSPYRHHYRWADELSSLFGTKVMLQHGITKDDMTYFHYPWLRTDLFCCGADPEYRFIRKRFGFPRGVVKYTGFARFDNLLKPHPVKKQVLLMPTWRTYATNSGREDFEQSLLYQTYQSLITNRRLDQMLSESGYELVFYPHYEMQKHIDSFHTESEHITIAGMKDYDVQKLLVESAVLITDFSSVFFDFAYMGKPVVYYQFDEQEYRAGHYKKGYFSYRRDGFGPVVETEEKVLQALGKYLKTGKMEQIYRNRVDAFFPRRDTGNCERIYQEILSIKGRER